MKPLFALAGLSLALGACGPSASQPTTEQVEAAVAAVAAKPPTSRLPALTGRVVDLADLLTADEEARLVSTSAELERRTSDQLVIATIRSLEGRSVEDYARELGNHWGIGQADKDNGVLLVVAPTERKVRIAVGHGLEPILTNERAAQIIDRDLVPNFREELWSEGIEAGTRSIVATLIAHEREPRRGRP